MTKLKVLIVSRSFYPLNTPRSHRTTELAKEFSRQGHDVTVFTHRNSSHGGFETEFGVKIIDFGAASWKPIELKGSGPGMLIRRVLKRIGRLLLEYPDIQYMLHIPRALKQQRGFDLLISIAVPFPVHWGVARAWKKGSKTNSAKLWIADCGDPYMGAENDSYRPPFYFGWIEKWFMRKVDYVTIPVESARSAYYPEFHEKIRVIPQGFRFEDVKLAKIESPNKVPTFAYAGGFIPGRRDPLELISYLSSLDKAFKFIVYTRATQLVNRVIDEADKRFEIRDYLPRLELLETLGTMDFVVNFENRGERQIPSKLIDYAIVNKPILTVKTGNLDKNLVLDFLNGNYSNGLVVPNPDQYRIENVVSQFINLTDARG